MSEDLEVARPDAAAPDFGRGPVALWTLRRADGRMTWANEPARHLFDLKTGEPATGPGWVHGAALAPPGWEAWTALRGEALGADVGACMSSGWLRLVRGQPQWWHLTAQVEEHRIVVAAVKADAVADSASGTWAQHLQQRELLVREVHHRLKNNLQGVAGLLRQQADLNPPAAMALQAAAGQLQTMAQVYGLQTNGAPFTRVGDLVRTVAQGVASVFGVPVQVVDETAPALPGAAEPSGDPSAALHAAHDEAPALRQTLWAHLEGDRRPDRCTSSQADGVHTDQAASLALALNELMTNAVKHATCSTSVCCTLRRQGERLELDIVNAGQWPDRMKLGPIKPGAQGLGLVQALLPRRGAELSFFTESAQVCARLHIGPPLLRDRGQTV